MKPEEPESKEKEDIIPAVSGDAIGETAYSERFVLKILLKLANINTLQEEIKEKSFEDDLCTLWDMTAEKDVVVFLQKHDVMNLINFALPTIESLRLVEILIGIIANMCCQKDVVENLLNNANFLTSLLKLIDSDDSTILIQVLRIVSSGLYVAEDADITVWMTLFNKVTYAQALYFILKNSSYKDLLVAALENLNTVCSYCNCEIARNDFFKQFVTVEAMESLSETFTEITTNQIDKVEKDELERTLVISLQIILNLVGFNKSAEIYNESKEQVLNIIRFVLKYYENKLVVEKEIDSDLVDIIDSTTTIVGVLNLSQECGPDSYFQQSYNMWKALKSINKITKPEQHGPNFEEADKSELQEFSQDMQSPLSTLICLYLEECSDENLIKAWDEISSCYQELLSQVKDNDLITAVSERLKDICLDDCST